jgi:predicted dehydrogenase
MPDRTVDKSSRREARLAVVGAGLIGRRHIEIIKRDAELAAIVDPSPDARALAEALGATWLPELRLLLDGGAVDGIVIATPNQMHVEQGLACVEAGIPVLVEKPIANDLAAGTRLVEAAEAAGVPVLVGHHRRHNPLVSKARDVIRSGGIGTVLAVHATCWFHKPDEYFEVAWRREKGGGPILLNLIHDVDLLRYICGDVLSVQAMISNAVRGHPVEDTAGILLSFVGGAIGTISVSDAIAAPWSWELTAGENPAYPRTGEACYQIGGTKGSLSIPDLAQWHYAGKRSWWEPIERRSLIGVAGDPLVFQMRHFAEVALGRAQPIVTARDALETLRVVVAIGEAAASGQPVRLA